MYTGQAKELLTEIWPEWTIVQELGSGSFGTVYKISRSEMGMKLYSALKIVSIPQDRSEPDSLIQEGMSDATIEQYYENMIHVYLREIAVLEKLKGTSHIVSIEDFHVVREPGVFRWHILIRMELLKSFRDFISEKKSLSEQDILRMGMDLCKALSVCEQENIVHRDIKPENVFVTRHGEFKLGDFGIAKTVEGTASSITGMRGTYNYMAPEVFLRRKYSHTVDIYALGLLMYRLMNNNRLPFLDPYKEVIDPAEREDAFNRRMSGEKLPAPAYASPKLTKIILKACSYSPADRYQSAVQMHAALKELYQRAGSSSEATASEPTEIQSFSERSSAARSKPGFRKGRVSVLAAVLCICLLAFFIVKVAAGPARKSDVPAAASAENIPAAQAAESSGAQDREAAEKEFYKTAAKIKADIITQTTALLREKAVPKVTVQAEDAFTPIGETAVFHIEAEGIGLTYQWEWQSKDASEWINCTAEGCQTDTLTVVSDSAIAESRYRCTVTDQFGRSKHSAKRELTVLDFQKYAISVSAIPQEITLGASETTKVQVVIDGSEFPDHIYSYCWFKTDKLTIEEGDWGSEPFGFPLKITAENPYEGSVRVCVLNEEDSTCLAYTDILVHKK